MDDVAGLILAGGQSRRMGGGDKCLMPLQGMPLIEHVSRKLSSKLPNVLINTNADQQGFMFLDKDIKADVFEGYAGPLAGVLTGMRWAEEVGGIKRIITAAADTPFFPDDYIERMITAAKHKEIVLASSDGRKHPVFGLWNVSLADELQTFLENGDRKVMLFVQKFAHQIEEFAVGKIDPFFNVNTPEDWENAEQIMVGNTHV